MGLKIMSATRVLVIAGVMTVAGAGVLLAQSTTRVSVDSLAREANASSWKPAISADGRFVAFISAASNLVPGDTNAMDDVFVHDRQTGTTTRVTVDSQGREVRTIWIGSPPDMSADGRFVAFNCSAPDLVPDDTNGVNDVFVHDCQTGETTRVSVDSEGHQANDSSGWFTDPTISADGRLVAFSSFASNLVPNDTNGVQDVFVHDRLTGETRLVSVDSQGQAIGGEGGRISADGRFVAFGYGQYGERVFRHDLKTGTTTLVSVNSQGEPADYVNRYPAISGDGRLVIFESSATNLVPGSELYEFNVFVHDCETGTTTCVTVDPAGKPSGVIFTDLMPAISDDGRFVAFESDANDLVPGDTNGWQDAFVPDLWTGQTTLASVNSQGEQGNGNTGYQLCGPDISSDGRYVVFASSATNLEGDDRNGALDIFVRDRVGGPCSSPASWFNYGDGWPGAAGVPSLVATSDPLLCSALSIVASNSSGFDTTGFLLAGFNSANLPTAWGGTLLLLPGMAISVGVPAAGLSLTAPIPCDDSLCGLSLYVQVVEMDPGASRGVSFTPGLQLRLGVQ